MSDLPFNQGTKIYQGFQTLMDCNWHCGKHELPGTQPAKAIQIIRQHSYEIEKKTIYCSICVDKTVHRRLVSTTATNISIVRSNISESLKKRVKAVYQNTDAITQREHQPAELEVDHRFPQVRWSKPEDDYPLTMSVEEIKANFSFSQVKTIYGKAATASVVSKPDSAAHSLASTIFMKAMPIGLRMYHRMMSKAVKDAFGMIPINGGKVSTSLLKSRKMVSG